MQHRSDLRRGLAVRYGLHVDAQRHGGEREQRQVPAVREREVHSAVGRGPAVRTTAGRARFADHPYVAGFDAQPGTEQYPQRHMGRDIAAAVGRRGKALGPPLFPGVEDPGGEPLGTITVPHGVHDPQGRYPGRP